MSGSTSQLTALAERKRLLLLESEINRAQFLEDWENLGAEAKELLGHGRAALSKVGVLAMTAAGFSAVRHFAVRPGRGKRSRFGSLLNLLQLGGSLWSMIRARVR